MRIQPGVKRILNHLGEVEHILDLGCGNGVIARYLLNHKHRGFYTGIDFSQVLIETARQLSEKEIRPQKTSYTFQHADLTSAEWNSALPSLNYTVVCAFAVLHHIPGNTLRYQILSRVHNLLQNNPLSTRPGCFIHSEWQFLNRARLKNRIVDWGKVGLTSQDVEPMDYLVDWRHGGFGVRYVHQFTEAELFDLAQATGFNVSETFYSDGEGGQLGLYQIWEAV